MPTPTIPAGNLFMNATTYTGTGATQTITNGASGASFQPDFVWMKKRSSAESHILQNSITGTTKFLISNSTAAEDTSSAIIQSFNTDGVTLGVSSVVNGASTTYVAWQWKAGGTAVTNNVGSISSQVSANTTSGFSVVTYTGNGVAGATVGHGLGVAPSMIIVKPRTGTMNYGWRVYHVSVGATKYLSLNVVDRAETFGDWNNTAPTSSVFSIGSTSPQVTNESGSTYVAYCWSEIAGFSAFGSYTGNGSADGPFVYTGFRPKYIMWKRSSGVGDWLIQDTSRSLYNLSDAVLYANYADAEGVGGGYGIDILSNGFKFRTSATYANASGSTYIYMAFAENPFKYANAR